MLSYLVTAESDGTIRAAIRQALAFSVMPGGDSPGVFPLTGRRAGNRGEPLTVLPGFTYQEAEGFERVDLSGATPGGTYVVSVAEYAGDDVRPFAGGARKAI